MTSAGTTSLSTISPFPSCLRSCCTFAASSDVRPCDVLFGWMTAACPSCTMAAPDLPTVQLVLMSFTAAPELRTRCSNISGRRAKEFLNLDRVRQITIGGDMVEESGKHLLLVLPEALSRKEMRDVCVDLATLM